MSYRIVEEVRYRIFHEARGPDGMQKLDWYPYTDEEFLSKEAARNFLKAEKLKYSRVGKDSVKSRVVEEIKD